MVEVQSLTKSYGDRLAVKDLNFRVNKGEVVGFLGPNGAGKTTTMKIITGYMPPSSGSVKVAGFDVFEDPLEVKRRIGYLPETPPVYLDMFIQDYLKFAARLKGLEKSKVQGAVDAAMEQTGLTEVRRRLIGNLSKGFRQRVGLAQALVSDPEVLILDEPTVGLDPKQVHEMRSLVHRLKGKHTIILSTHILPEVQATCDRIIVINRGQIVAQDSIVDLSRRMSSGGGQIKVHIRRNAEELKSSLKGVKGVLGVEAKGLWLDMNVEPGEDVIEAVASHIVQKGAGLIELRALDMNLEDIFIKLTSSDGVRPIPQEGAKL